MKDLFSSLSRYRVGAWKTPIEDFFTQSFVWLLARNPRMASELLERLCGIRFSPDRATLKTQQIHGNCRIDVAVEDDRHLLFIENKIDAPVAVYGEGDKREEAEASPVDQIRKYQALAKRLAGPDRQPFVLLISRTPTSCDAGPPFRSLLWSEVFDVLSKLQDHCDPAWRPLLREFLAFMEEMKMTFKGLNPEDAEIARRIDGVYAASHLLLSQAMEGAGIRSKSRTDWDTYAAYYIKDPDKCWAGLCYWGERFGRVVVGVHGVDKRKRGSFETAGLTWDDLTGVVGGVLPFEEYASLKAGEQVAKVSAFLKETLARTHKAFSALSPP